MSGDLKWNKIFGAGLATVFTILVVNEVSGLVFHTSKPEKMGYFIDVPEEEAGAGASVELPPDWGTVLPIADLAAGERAYARCIACHTINAGGADGIGPNLYGIVGGGVGNNSGFDYSPALREHAGNAPVWTYDELDLFITAPNRHIRGTRMSFAGIRNTEERVNLIAYLRQQGSGGYPVPAPDPARQPQPEGEAEPDPAAVPGSDVDQTASEGIAETAPEQATAPAQPTQ